MKKLLLLIIIICSEILHAQNCGNVGFENGDNTGWSGYIGSCSNGTAGGLPTLTIPNAPQAWTTPQGFFDSNNEFPDAYRFVIMTPDSGINGFDPIVSAVPVVSPWGGTRSLRLGNPNTGSNAERVRFTYPVTAQNANFVYQYAIILENPAAHASFEQAAFRIKITKIV